MDWIPAKLRTIRQEFKMTQLEMAQASGLSQRDISQLENGRKEGLPKEFIQFLHSRGVDLNWLFTDPEQPETAPAVAPGAPRNYATLESDSLPTLAREDQSVGYGPRRPLAAPAGNSSATEAAPIRLIGSEAQKEYSQRYLDPAFYQALPVFALPLPEVQQGVVRCFQVAGSDMAPALAAGDWVIALLDDAAGPVVSGSLYVLVTPDQVRVRRVFSHPDQPGVLVLRADAASAVPTPVPLTSIVERWRVRGHLSFQLPPPEAAPPKVAALEANLQDLLARVQRLEQGQ